MVVLNDVGESKIKKTEIESTELKSEIPDVVMIAESAVIRPCTTPSCSQESLDQPLHMWHIRAEGCNECLKLA